MITGAHAIIYSTAPDADRAFLRDVLALSHVDVGGGWLIFGLPPAEVAVHPSDANGTHELYLLVDDVEAFMAQMAERDIACAPLQNPGWGLLTELTLPGGGKLGVYQPRHARPPAPGGPTSGKGKPKTSARAKAKANTKPQAKAKTKPQAKARPKPQAKARPKAAAAARKPPAKKRR
jgi:hypothetical protein